MLEFECCDIYIDAVTYHPEVQLMGEDVFEMHPKCLVHAHYSQLLLLK